MDTNLSIITSIVDFVPKAYIQDILFDSFCTVKSG